MSTARRPKSGEHDTASPAVGATPAKTAVPPLTPTPTTATATGSTPIPSTAPSTPSPATTTTPAPAKTVKATVASKKAAAAAAEKAAADSKAAADAAAASTNNNNDEKTATLPNGGVDHSAEVARLSRRSRAVAADCQRTVERILSDQKTIAIQSFGAQGRPRDDAEKELAAKMERTRREMERRQRELVAAMAAMVKATAAAASLQSSGDETKRTTEYVKVAVRTRPTPQFADDAIKIEPEKNVKSSLLLLTLDVHR
jgi:hypothetical protein